MGFFDADLPPVPEETGGHVLYARAEGASYGVHARDYVVPGVLPWVRRLGVGPDTQVWLRRVDVWTGGFSLELAVFRRIVRSGPSLGPTMRDDPSVLRIGLVMADGTRATSVGRGYALPAPPGAPGLDADPDSLPHAGGDGSGESYGAAGTDFGEAGAGREAGTGNAARGRLDIALMVRSGSMYNTSYHAEVPLLPPEGPVAVVVEWPAEHVPETRTELDGTAIREAAGDAVEVWPDLPRRPDGAIRAYPGLTYYAAAPQPAGGMVSVGPGLPGPPLLPSPYSTPPYPPSFPMPPYPDAPYRPDAPPPTHAPGTWQGRLPYAPPVYGVAYGPLPYGPPSFTPHPQSVPPYMPPPEGPPPGDDEPDEPSPPPATPPPSESDGRGNGVG
ncbi:hypothetical protein [Streptodolium elevatio]